MKTAFLIGFGPSFRTMDKGRLLNLPVPVACCGHWCFVNGIRTDHFFSFDPPGSFPKGIYADSRIAKHTRFALQAEKSPEGVALRECPNMHFYDDNLSFDPKTFLTEPTVNWGDDPLPLSNDELKKIIDSGVQSYDAGVRASVLAALRILYQLGFRRVFMVGYDFAESDYRPHQYWRRLVERFKRLKPTFTAAGYELLNCSRNSALRCYPFIELDEAIAMVGREHGSEVCARSMDAPGRTRPVFADLC